MNPPPTQGGKANFECILDFVACMLWNIVANCKITEKENHKNRPRDNEIKVKKGIVVCFDVLALLSRELLNCACDTYPVQV